MISAKANLGLFDARYHDRDGSDWIQTMADKFLLDIQLANIRVLGACLTEKINSLLLGIHECKASLRGDWNTVLPMCPNFGRNLKRIVETERGTGGPKKLRKLQGRKTIRKASKKRKGTFEHVTPPPKPLQEEHKIPCQEQTCDVTFTSESAMKTHFNKKHPDSNYQPPAKVLNPLTGKMGVQKLREDKVSL